jgi:hypothetical protein
VNHCDPERAHPVTHPRSADNQFAKWLHCSRPFQDNRPWLLLSLSPATVARRGEKEGYSFSAGDSAALLLPVGLWAFGGGRGRGLNRCADLCAASLGLARLLSSRAGRRSAVGGDGGGE